MLGLWKRALGQMGKGKSSPGVQSPVQHSTSAPAALQPGPSTAGLPRKGHFFLYFQEKSHSLPAEELKCSNGCSQHSPPLLMWVLLHVCLSALLTNELLPREPGLGAPGRDPASTGQGEASPGLAPHTQHPVFHEHSHSLCALQVGPGSSRAGMDPKGLLRDRVGSVPPHTLPGWADKPSFYRPLLFVCKMVKNNPLLLQVPWPQCPTLARSRKEVRQILFSSLLSPKSPRSQCQCSTSLPPTAP